MAITNCSTSLKIEIVKEFVNVSADCGTSLCGGGHQFYQMKYRVFLRYSANTPPVDQVPFDLQYKSLKVSIGLDILGSTPNGFTHIDEAATMACYDAGPGANWSDTKVGFKAYRSSGLVEIDFQNPSTTSTCGTGDDAIHFTWGTPAGLSVGSCFPSTYCAYAELFSVVVNAYPGESFRLSQKASVFIPFDDELHEECSPISLETSGLNNGFSSVTATLPQSHVNTPNANLLAEVLNPVDDNGNQKFEVRVRNTGTTAMSIRYLEFVAQVAPSFTDIALNYSGSNHTPDAVLAAGNTRKLHYRLVSPTGITINGTSSYTVGYIIVSPPNPTNQPWSVEVSLIDDTKSRVRSVPAGSTTFHCTKLPLSTAIRNHNDPGHPGCTTSPAFRVQPKNGLFDICSGTPAMIQVGFDQISSNSTFKFSRLVFEIKFDLTDDLAISGVNYDDWISSWTCPTPIDNTCLDSGSDDPCWDIIGDDVIRFCFAVVGQDAITITGDRYINIEFNNAVGCIKKAIITHLEVTPFGDVACIPPIDNTLQNPTNSVCPPQVRGRVRTELGDGVEAVDMELILDSAPSSCTELNGCTNNGCTQDILTTGTGAYGFCIESPCNCNCFKVTPFKDDNRDNGVTTYDLVLISKHILGLEPLNSPYKMIAADANKSKSISTFDIVEFRKLILGIYNDSDSDPNNDWPTGNVRSWRFVDQVFSFPNPLNPFQTDFPEEKMDISAAANIPVNFVGVKTGDVNNSAIANRPNQRPVMPIAFPIMRATAGDVITVPVTYTGRVALDAFQLGLRYDTSALKLISPSQGDLPQFDAGSVFIPYPGEIRTLWLPMDQENPDLHIEPGAVLFNLTFRVLSSSLPTTLPLFLDEEVLYNAVWKRDGTECAVQNVPASSRQDAVAPHAPAGMEVNARPNPTSGEAALQIQSPHTGKARIVLMDAFGRWLGTRDVALTPGFQEVALPEVKSFPAGVYLWKVYSKGQEAQGQLIKF
ncbi:MAG: hypothetical protein J0M29_07610 [Chitinophagales bacterium]|nr:hypothetical protein [Chitinophagales bacterium]